MLPLTTRISFFLSNETQSDSLEFLYSSVVYLELGRRGRDLAHSPNPSINIRFPILDDSKASAKEMNKKSRKTVADDSGWVKTKPKKAAISSRKTKTTRKRSTKAKPARASGKPSRANKPSSKGAHPEVIDILSSDDSDDEPVVATKPSAPSRQRDDMFDSTSEEEFD